MNSIDYWFPGLNLFLGSIYLVYMDTLRRYRKHQRILKLEGLLWLLFVNKIRFHAAEGHVQKLFALLTVPKQLSVGKLIFSHLVRVRRGIFLDILGPADLDSMIYRWSIYDGST